jgi:alpha-glucosidase
MLKRWLLKAGLCALALQPVQAVEIEGLEPIGAYSSHAATDRGLEIQCQDGSRVRLQWLTPDLVRVRTAFRKPFDPIDHSWAVAKTNWAPVPLQTSESPDRLVSSSADLTVIVHKNPLRVEIQDKQGRTLNQDHHPLMGDVRGVQKAQMFDPTAGTMLVATKSLGLDEHFYGLGEKAHKLDRRRGHFTMWNSDTPRYNEGKDPIYQSIPFYIGLNKGTAYGLFYDNSHRSHFDMGFSQQEWAGYAVEGGEVDYYFIGGPKIHDVVSRYTELTGRMYLPPKWALGHQASRWSYYPASMVEEIAATYQSHDLPLDVMTLDIDYMQGYRVFTWDKQRFPDPAGMIKRLAARGLKTVTIVDPGVKYQPTNSSTPVGSQPELQDQSQSYYVFNEGLAKNYFVKRSSGQPMVTKVWPGETVFVDYTLEAARKWWGDLHRALLDQGVAGIWNDMNEPADFTDKGEVGGENQKDSVFDDLGRKTRHAKNRNLVALLMCRSTYEGLLRLRPGQRPYIITRAAYAGIQRYATMWTGDAPSTWESLALSVPMFCSLGLSGESFVGADVGGFMNRGDGEMLTRAYQISFLIPFCRNHKDRSGYDQEPWRFGPYYENIIRRYLKLRYSLLPYIYAGMAEAQRSGVPFIRPLVSEYQNDPMTWSLDDQFLAGRDLLVAPVTRPGQEARRVYLPEGRWYDFWSHKVHQGGQVIRVEAPLETVPMFVRGGAILPMGPEKNTVDAKPDAPLELHVFPGSNGTASVELYEDDGTSEDYRNGEFSRRRVSVQGNRVQLAAAQGSYRGPQRPLKFHFYGQGKAAAAVLDGQTLPVKRRGAVLDVTIPDDRGAHNLELR